MNKKANRLLFIAIHLFAMVSIFTLIATGLRISTLQHMHWLWLAPILPEGRMHLVHIYSGICMLVLCVAYLFYRYRYKHVFTQSRYHHWVNILGNISISLTLLTGFFRWLDIGPSALGILHYYSANGVILYLLLHSYVYFLSLGKGLIAKVFQFKALMRNKLAITLSATACLLGIYVFNHFNSHTLYVLPLSDSDLIAIDGKDSDPFWQKTPWHTVNTYGGANFNNGFTPVQIKVASNHIESYFLFRWQDQSKSLTHLPLVKLDERWQVKQNGFQQFNETRYYEDKFAVLLSQSCGFGGDNTSYLGKKPIANKPSNWHDKGYHAALDGRIRDLWHWKALRTNDMVQMDDNVIANPLAPRAGERRYTAGYYPDGKESGAYVMNWLWYAKNAVTPKRLPLNTGEFKESHVLPWFSSSPYQAKKDNYQVGDTLPSVLYRSNRFEGDRGDVTAKGHWQNGYWTLEVARRNDTQSKYDVALEDGVCLWVSAFDHAQIAHTRHQRPLKLHYQFAQSTREM